MIGIFAISFIGAIIWLIVLTWFMIVLNDIRKELRINNKQQALVLAIMNRQEPVTFDHRLRATTKQFYDFKEGNIFPEA